MSKPTYEELEAQCASMRHQLKIIYDHIYNFWPDEAIIDKETWMARIDTVLNGEKGEEILIRLELLQKIADTARDFLKGFNDSKPLKKALKNYYGDI